jgi:predicted nicotinamide N-methyase
MAALVLLATVGAQPALVLLATVGAQPVRLRPVTISPELTVTVYELAQPTDLVNSWYEAPSSAADPFGVVLWPGALYASRRLWERRESLAGASVAVMGAGTGLEALTAAALGASVVACDINCLTLELLGDAARGAGLSSRLETRTFDLRSDDALPPADLTLFSDTFYTRELAQTVAHRCDEVLARGSQLLLTDSQRTRHTDVDRGP